MERIIRFGDRGNYSRSDGRFCSTDDGDAMLRECIGQRFLQFRLTTGRSEGKLSEDMRINLFSDMLVGLSDQIRKDLASVTNGFVDVHRTMEDAITSEIIEFDKWREQGEKKVKKKKSKRVHHLEEEEEDYEDD